MTILTRYDPVGLSRPFGDMLDRFLGDSVTFHRAWDAAESRLGSSAPSLYETKDGYELHVALPGAKAEALDIAIHGDVVTIQGKTEWSSPEKATMVWRGIRSGKFNYAWRLPTEVEADEVKANLSDGILRLTLPKEQRQRPHQIKVESKAA